MGQNAIYKNTVLLSCSSNYPQLFEALKQRNVFDCTQLKSQCLLIGEGCTAKIYWCKRLNIAIKINKHSVDVQRFCKQISILYKASSLWPGIFDQLALDNDQVVGYSMKYFEGKKIWEAYCDPTNIYFQKASSRVRLVKRLKQEVKKLQSLQIGHGDLHIDNIMIRQPNQNKEECEILIIDYGLAFIMDQNTPQKPSLTGWKSMKPVQAKTKDMYNATGLNAFMFGRVALQILMLRKYSDYDHSIDQNPMKELNSLHSWGFDVSVRKQIELYLSNDIQERKKALFEESKMKEQVSQNQLVKMNAYQNPSQLGWSFHYKNQPRFEPWDQDYYIKHPQKMGYQD